MRNYLLLHIFLFILSATLSVGQSVAQCVSYPPNATSSTPASCRGGSDGTIAVSVIPGASGFHSFLLQRYDIAQNKFIDIQGPIPTAATTYTFTGLTASQRYRVVAFDADEVECDEPAITSFIAVSQPAAALKVSLATKKDVENCFGDATGSLSVTASGGNGGYTYTINGTDYFTSGTFNNLPASDYTVGVKDAKGCVDQISVTISQPTKLQISLTSSANPLCAGVANGSIAVSAAGGTPGYQYSINGGVPAAGATFNSLPAGTYTIEVTDSKGCKATLPAITLVDPAALTAAINTKTNASCNGATDGTATVDAAGGTGPYSFSWNTTPVQHMASATDLKAGTYTVTVTDANGCSRTASVTIGQPAVVAAPIAANAVICQGQSVPALTATGSNIIWYNNADAPVATGLSFKPAVDETLAGTHTFYATQTVDGCESSRTTVTLTINAEPAAPAATSPAPVCEGTPLTLSASGSNITWFDANASVLGTGNAFVLPDDKLVAGTETFYVTQTVNGCESKSTAVTVTILPSPAKPVITGTASFCQGGSTTLTSSAAASNQWLLNNSPIAGETNQTLIVTAAGTYSVRVTNGSNCSATAEPVTVSQIAQPAAPTVADVAYCQGATPSALAVSGSDLKWYTTATGGTDSATTPVVSTAVAGTTSYFVTQMVNGCESPRAQLTVTIHANPDVPAISGNVTFCAGGSTTLTSSATSGNQWYKDGAVISGATGQSLVVTQEGTYSVTVTNPNNCTATSSGVTVNEATVVTPAISGTLTFCQGDATTLTSSAASGNQWNLNGNPIAGETGQTLIATVAGDYTVTVTQGGCSATSAIARVSVSPLPSAPAVSSNSPICAGSTLNLTASAVAGATYSWTGPSGFASAQQNPTINAATTAASGTYSVIVTTANGCTSTAAEITVQVDAQPATPAISGNNSFCQGTSTVLTSSVAAGNQWYRDGMAIAGATGQTLNVTAAGAYSVTVTSGTCSSGSAVFNVSQTAVTVPVVSGTLAYCQGSSTVLTSSAGSGNQWYKDGVLLGGENGQTLPVNSPGAYTVSVAGNGCTATSAVANVTETPVPAPPAATSNGPLCAGATLNVSASTVADATYSWTGPNGFISAVQNPSINSATVTASGTYSVTVTVNGCTSMAATVSVTINALPDVPAISGSNTFCPGGNTLLTSNSTTGNQWFKDGASLNGETGQTLTVSTAGNYSVQVTNAAGCSAASTNVTVTQAAIAVPTISGTLSYCQGGSTVLTSSAASGNQWYRNGTLINGATGQTFTAATAGDYTIVVSANGCSATSVIAKVTETPAPAAPVTSSNGPICEGSTLNLTASAIAGATYNWTGPNGFAAAGQNVSIPNAIAGNSGRYTVTVTANNCTNSAAVDVTVSPQAAKPTISGASSICVGSSTLLTSSAASGNQWYRDGVLLSGATAQTLSVTSPGSYTVTVTSAGGCSNVSAALTVGQAATFTVNVTGTNPNSCTASNGTLTASASPAGSYGYSLDGTNFSNTSGAFNGLGAGSYTVFVKNNDGCMVQQSFQLSSGSLSVAVDVTGETACNAMDGSVTITPSGGVSPYIFYVRAGSTGSYSEIGSNKVSGLEPGTYWLRVIDDTNCSFEATVTVSKFDCNAQPCTLTASGASTDPSCSNSNGGSITVTSTGGTGPYTYSLNGTTFQASNVFSGLPAGAYNQVTVKDAAGCNLVLPAFTLNAPTTPAAPVATSPAPVCAGSTPPQLTASGSGITWYSDAGLTSQVGTGSPFVSSVNTAVAGTTSFYVTQTVNGCKSPAVEVVVTVSAPIDFNFSKTDPTSCSTSDGSVTVDGVIGGSGSYQYSIDGTNYQTATAFNGLGGGNYLVYVKDGEGCIGSKSVQLTAPGGFTATVTPSNETGCNVSDGIISVTGLPGDASTYKYYLDGSINWAGANISVFTGLTPGTYTVTVEASDGCTFTAVVTVGTNCVPACSITANVTGKTDPACPAAANGSLTVSATGGSGMHEYSLDGTNYQDSPTFSGLIAGDYTITVRDKNNSTCKFVLSGVALSDPAGVVASVELTNPTCAGNDGSLQVTATGGSGVYSYSVDGGNTFSNTGVFNSLVAGSHTVVVKDNKNCSVTLAPVTLTAGPNLTASVSGTNPTGCSATDGTITIDTVTGGTKPYSYSLDGTVYQSGSTFNNLPSGNYTVYIRDAKGCQITSTHSLSTANGISASIGWTDETACNAADGTLTISNPTGATGPFEYFINGSADADGIATNLTPAIYTIRVVAANGCAYNTTVTVGTACTNPPACNLTASSSKTDPSCANPNGGSVTVTPSGGTAPYTYAFNSPTFAAGTGVFSNLAGGDYNITVKDAAGCTFSLNTITLTAPAVPTAPVAVSPAPVCSGSTMPVLTATGTDLKWYDSNNVLVGTDDTFTPAVNAVGTYTYSVTQTVNGCESAKTTVFVTINATPDAPAVLDVTYCQGVTPSALTASGSDLKWYTVATGGNGSATPPAVATDAAGTTEYFVSQTVNSCESPRAKLTVTVTGNVVASVSIVADQTNICAGSPVTFTATPTNGGTAPAYQWQVNGVDVTGATNNVFTSSLNNGDQVRVVLTAGGSNMSCTSGSPATSNAIAVNVNNTSVAGVTVSADQTSVCPSTPVTFTAVPANGGTALAYQWRVNGANVSGATNATFTSSTLNNNDEVTVVMTAGGNNTSCITGSPAISNGVTITVSNNLTASVSISADQTTICTGTSVTFTATPVNGGTAPAYQWRVNGVDVAGATNSTFITSALADNDQVSVRMATGGSGTGCISGSPATSNVLTMVVSNSLTASVSIAADQTSLCTGTTVTFTATAVNGGTAPLFQWQVNGSNVAGATGTTFTSNTLNNNDQVSVVMTPGGNNTSCISGGPVVTNTVDVTVSSSLTASVSIAADQTSICSGTPVNFTATPQNGGTVPTYQWKINGVDVTGATNSTFTSSTLANNDQVSVVMTAGGNNTSCITGSPAASNAIAVTVNTNATASVSIAANAMTICAGVPVTFTATATNGGTNPAYQWQINGTAVTGAVNATFTSSTLANGDRVSVAMTAGGTGTACTTGSPATSNVITMVVTSNQPASVSIVADRNNVCAGTAVIFTATPSNGGTAPTLQWRINGVDVAGATSTTFTSSTLSNNDQVTVVMAAGSDAACVTGSPSTSNAVSMVIKPTTDPTCGCNMTVAYQATNVKCKGDDNGETSLFVVSGGSGSYEYKIGDKPYQDSPNFTGLPDGTYTFTVRDKVKNCTAATNVTIGANFDVAGLITRTLVNTCGGTGSIEFTVVSGTGLAPYQVSIDGGATYQDWPATKLFPNLNPATYMAVIKDANGCTYTQAIEIIGMPPIFIVSSVTKQPTNCTTSDGEITLAITGGTAPFRYSVNNGAFADLTSDKIGQLAAGNYTVTVKDANNCETTTSLSLAVEPITFTIQKQDATCENPTVTVKAILPAGQDAKNYLFSIDGSSFVPGGQNGLAEPEFKNLIPGSYTMYVRTLNGSCPVTSTFNIGGVTGITYQVSQVNIGCEGGDKGSIKVYDITGGTVGNAPANYGISIDGGKTFMYTGENTMTFNNLKSGTYPLVLAYGQCRTAVKEVVVTSSGVPFTVKTTPSTCGSPNGTAEAMLGENGKKYFYSINNINFSESPLFTNLKPGSYKMHIRENASDLCANVLPFTVPGPDSLKATIRREACNNVVLSPIEGGVKPYRVSIDGGKTFVSGNIFDNSYIISNLPDGDYEVIVADNQDCRTFPVNLRISNKVSAKVKATLSMNDEPTGEIQITDIRGGTAPYEVSLNGTNWGLVKDASIPYDTIIRNQPVGIVNVYVRDANGCVQVYAREVKESTFLIPNVFTPNADGVNDTFFIRNLPPSTIVRIVNRWGKLIYESANYQNDWNGGEYPDGIYYYTVNIAGQGTFSGWVQIWH